MNCRLLTVFFFLAFSLFSCGSSETVSPMVGIWKASSGSRVILPSGFESRHNDKSPTYLVPQGGELTYEFNQDGTFELNAIQPPHPSAQASGLWTLKGDDLNLEILERQNYEYGITQFKVPVNDDSNLDLQWSVQYLEFSDAKFEELRNNGIFESDSYTISTKDSLLNSDGILINSFITIHYEKI